VAEPERLSGGTRTASTGEAASAPAPPEDYSGPSFLNEDRAPQRATIYWVLLLVLLAGTLLLRQSPWQSGPQVHTFVEIASTILGLVIGSLALVRFYSKKRGTYLFIGTGFLGTAVLDGYHALITSELVPAQTLFEAEDLSAWSWIGSRLFLSLFLYVSWLAWRREDWEGGPEEVKEASVYATGVFLTGLIFAFVAFVPTGQAYYPELPVHRPAEFLPALFFSLALGGFLLKGSWRRDPFEHWLVVALLLSAVAHTVYMPFSSHLHDAAYDAAHLLKLVSYVAVLIGLLVSVYVTFRREEVAMEEIQNANDALAREVAVRRRAERVLQESEERLQDFLDNANDLIQSTAPDGTLLYVNQAWLRTLGYEYDEVEGRSMWDFVHDSCLARCREYFDRVLEGEAVTDIEMELVARDGSVVICSGSSNCRFEDGEPVAARSIFRDVTEQRRAEREMAASQANLAALIESTGDAIWSVDEDHRLITFNSSFSLAMETRTGREPEKGDPPDRVFRPEDVSWYREQYDRALGGERFSETRSEELHGQERHFEVFFNPIIEARGIQGVVAFGRDVTRRIHAEEALRLAKEEAEAANRAKSQFLANMSHELRTPLNSVIGFTNILLKNQQGNLNDKQLNFLDRVLSNGRHLLTLINEVLDLAKIEAGRMELEIEEVDLDELVRETLAQLEGQVRSKGKDVDLRPEVPRDIEPLRTDRAKLKQVIINLVGNALKFTEEGEVAVIVESGENGSYPRKLHISDTGIGIPDDRLEAIFEAFQQADASTSRKYGGTGLGLTISQSICQMLEYEVDVESEVGVGSTFTIDLGPPASWRGESGEEAVEEVEHPDLPDAPVVEEDGSQQEEVGDGIRNFEVLVIDDEADSRTLMRHFLEEFGCQVTTAASGREGIERARTVVPDLITLDLMMPEMDGWETLRTLKGDPDLKEIPVVVVSIVAGENRGSLLGAVDLINKPVEREDLLRVLWRNLLRTQGVGRVLVVEDDEDTRTVMEEYLEEAGLEVSTAENGADALRLLGRDAPDAVVLDLMMPVMDGMTFLEKLRAQPEYTGLPVIVVTAKELTSEERQRLHEMASGIVPKGEDVEVQLREYLGTLFHLEEETAGD